MHDSINSSSIDLACIQPLCLFLLDSEFGQTLILLLSMFLYHPEPHVPQIIDRF